jgi:hypothetical protein
VSAFQRHIDNMSILVSPSNTPPRPRLPATTTLDELVARLRVLQALGAGGLPVLIETRNRMGEVIYGSANARQDTVIRVDGGFRQNSSCTGVPIEVIRIG